MAEQWDIEQHTPNGDYVMHKEFITGPDVFIAINKVAEGFQVEISAASPEGQDLEEVKGPFKTFESALDVAQEECKSWDAGRSV